MSLQLWQTQHPASWDGLCWAPQTRPGNRFAKPVNSPRRRCRFKANFSAGSQRRQVFRSHRAWQPCHPAPRWGGIATAARFARAGIQRGHQLLLQPPTTPSFFGAGAFPRLQYFPCCSLKLRSAWKAVSAFAGAYKNASQLNSWPVKPYITLHLGEGWGCMLPAGQGAPAIKWLIAKLWENQSR